MAHPAPAASRCTSEEFFELVARGVLAPDDRVELLEGVIVAMAPQNPRPATSVHMIHEAVSRAVGTRALVRQQFPLIAGLLSVPEPDVAVVPGGISDYLDRHPTPASLVVEVADSSIVQDRLTKTPSTQPPASPSTGWSTSGAIGWRYIARRFRPSGAMRRRASRCAAVVSSSWRSPERASRSMTSSRRARGDGVRRRGALASVSRCHRERLEPLA